MSEYGSQATVQELLPIRDELRSMIAGVSAAPKNLYLAEAAQDPYYSEAIEANGLLTKMALIIANAAGKAPKKFKAEGLQIPLEHWLDNAVFLALKDEGDHIIDFGRFVNPDDHLHFETVHSALIYGAHKAAERSNHPSFFVGARGFYTNQDRTRIGIFSTANSKEHDLAVKYCAEAANLDTAQENLFSILIAMSVSGDPQLDDDSNRFPPTLHPCFGCREELATNPLVTSTSHVVCANRDGRTQTFTTDQLRRYHGEF